MSRKALCLLLASVVRARADVIADPPSHGADEGDGAPRGDLGAFFEFHTHPDKHDFGSSQPGEFAWPPGVECRVLHDTAPVAQWIARPPPNQGSRRPYPSLISEHDQALSCRIPL